MYIVYVNVFLDALLQYYLVVNNIALLITFEQRKLRNRRTDDGPTRHNRQTQRLKPAPLIPSHSEIDHRFDHQACK